MTCTLLDQAETSIRHGSQSFAMASRLLGRSVRADTLLLYAWCRHCDDAVDGQIHGHAAQPVPDPDARLDLVRAQTRAALSGQPAEGPFASLAQVVARHDIPRVHPFELIDGFAMDVRGRRYHKIEETLDFCYHAAGVVGVMMAMVMGVRDRRALDHASDLGIAFQLTNIARDVVEDARAGRCYLPVEMRAARGLAAEADLTDPAAWPAAHKVACDLLHVAERYYASGRAGLAYVPRHSAWGIAAARRIYREIGMQIRRAAPDAWANRLSTGTWRKSLLVARSMTDPYRAKPVNRSGLWARPARACSHTTLLSA